MVSASEEKNMHMSPTSTIADLCFLRKFLNMALVCQILQKKKAIFVLWPRTGFVIVCLGMVSKIPAKKSYIITLCILNAVVFGFVGFMFGKETKSAAAISVATQAIRENNDTYKFIHPLLAVGRIDPSVPSPGYSNLLKSVQQYIDSEKSNSQLLDASVYFSDYKKGGGLFAINENQPYAPASMLKVVVMIGFLKESDSDNSILSKTLIYNSSLQHSIEDIQFESPSLLVVGQSYTVEDLIHRMIVDSDNGAMYLLLNNISDSYLSDVYTNLGLHGPTSDNPNYTISANDYSLFLRILYNATYLSRGSSEKALSYLSQATFKDGLVAGVPAGVVVAHKYGEHINGTLNNIDSVELHDCGYVYASNAPYLLCVMTKSKTIDESEKVISNISKIIYNGR